LSKSFAKVSTGPYQTKPREVFAERITTHFTFL